MAQSDNPKKASAAQARAFTPASLRQHLAFWRDELPAKFDIPFTLVHLYDEPDPCPICDGSKKYRPEGSDHDTPCFCQVQLYYRKRIEGWQDYTYLPQRYLKVNPDEILRAERGVTPIRRTQFSMALKAIDGFIANPHGNLILVGDIGMSRSMLAAYIATRLDPTPNIFITLRQLVDLLAKSGQSDSAQVHDILYRIPVLIIDNFSTTFGDLDNQSAQQLHDLIYYRWSEVLPVVLTTNVPLDDLRAVHGQLLEYLEQDAEVIRFDAKQVHMTRSTGGAAAGGSRQPQVPEQVQRCPFLGTADGSNPPGSFPSPHNHCLRVAHPQPIALAHQSAACLNEFGGCRVFQTPEAEVVDALPEDLLRVVRTDQSRRKVSWGLRLISIIAAIGVITGLAALGVIVLGPRLGELLPPEPTEEITTEPPTVTFTDAPPTPTATPATPSATPVPSETPSPTPNVIMQVTLSLPTNLRQLPEADAPVVALLPAGTALNVLGRDGLGIWVRVDTLDGQSGWVVVVQIAETIDVVSLPFYTDPTPAPPTVTPASVSTSGTPAASGIPASFTVVLIASEISGCDYPDVTTDYEFNMTENQLKVTRLVDGTILEGTFTRANGAFLVSATHSAFAETMSGAITLVGSLINLRGEHTLSYFNGACGAFYSISGQTSG